MTRIAQLEAALRKITAGLMPEDSAADHHNRYELCAARLCGIARRAITSETPLIGARTMDEIKPLALLQPWEVEKLTKKWQEVKGCANSELGALLGHIAALEAHFANDAEEKHVKP